MSGEITKIESIKNIAVFRDFRWNPSVRDEGNNIAEFKKINILYGRNYSGKTTLSRIFRSLETGVLSRKYSSPEFQITVNDSAVITQSSLNKHKQIIRVFNEDFVKENLHFIMDDEQSINSFAILGEDNTKLEEQIEVLEAELGSEEEKSGLLGKRFHAIESLRGAKKDHDEKSTALEEKLRDKANKSGTGIKHNTVFGDATYNLPKIKADIETVGNQLYSKISIEEAEKNLLLLKEDQKQEILEPPPFKLKYSELVTKAKSLTEKKIQASSPIQDLLNDAVLEAWVRSGREHHKGRDHCAFCGSDLPLNFWEKLENHFNKESEDLRTSIDNLIATINIEIDKAPDLLKIKTSDFYSKFTSQILDLENKFTTQSRGYIATLQSLNDQLTERKNDIFNNRLFTEPTSVEEPLTSIQDEYELLRIESNEFTAALKDQKAKARIALRLHEVSNFINDIKYNNDLTAIEVLNNSVIEAEKIKNSEQSKVDETKASIAQLKAQLKDESKGADRVNHYLNNFFGHQSLSLKPIEHFTDGTPTGYRFEVTRNGQKAYHLSEGECSLIAFCYFMAKLVDIETKGSQPIIWIDDPICSLDANHIFFVYSLINSEIASPERYIEDGESKERERFKQLFISTHNLDFFKYLKRLPGALNKSKSQYFLINRCDKDSSISIMPKYLKEYVTEFNYLFSQIHKCASIEVINDENYTTFYNFGNNARKFFEIYLYYKYPHHGMNDATLCSFFGNDNVPAILTDRINNEYSHLAGVFERGATPTEVPEMKTAASFILQRIKASDPDQYSALLQSIGAEAT